MAVENTLASGRQDQPKIKILPYSRMVGQQQIKLALEIAFISPPRLGGVLISGQRGTVYGSLLCVRMLAGKDSRIMPKTT
jgi:hypothetical protein